MILEFVVILISILLSAFFSGMEIAFVSSNKMHLELEKKKDTYLAKILKKLTQKPSKFITTMLVGNNIALVIYGYFMGDILMSAFKNHIAHICYSCNGCSCIKVITLNDLITFSNRNF